ncbi:MAG: ABC transporter permease subunit [Propionibacteriales bacterium]|nr:ABC transporter permease subunit [Propionibacteriales bacterium]
MTRMLSLLRQVFVVLALPVVLLAVWWVTSAGSENFYLPPLSEILTTFGEVWFSGRIVSDVLPSLLRLAAGYTLAALVGVGLGIAVGSSKALRETVEPVLEFGRAIPPPVLVPVLMLIAGHGNSMKILVILSGCIWPILLNTVEGVRAVDEVLVDTGRTFRMRARSRLHHLVLPAASPQIFAGLRQALSLGIILMVISEMFAASSGLGFTIVQFQRGFAIPEMWSGIILLGIIGFGLSLLFRLVESRALRWYEGIRLAERGGSPSKT